MAGTFLTAEWKKLLMVNYVVDPAILQPHVPVGTELDLWQGRCYVSVVGFMFVNTRLRGFRIPFHSNFEEVNLRFYVRYKHPVDGWRRGVVFIKEIVPKPALTFVANTIYRENYRTMPMAHRWEQSNDTLTVEYRWRHKDWNSISLTTANAPAPLQPGSEEEFITEHYWGYTRIGTARSAEYGVEHPAWLVYPPATQYIVNVDFGPLYGPEFAHLATTTPASVFLAEGSQIVVKEGHKLPHQALLAQA
jgi:uncharacterized protein YqjF (DUF2071 family)